MKTKQTLRKQILCFLLLLTLFMSLFCLSSMAGDEISVIIDGTKVEFDVPPMMQNDRVFVPLRKIGEALGAVVGWEEETQTVTFSKGDITNVLVVGERTAVKNSAEGTETFQMDVAPFIINDRTLVPVRYISESFQMTVDWDNDTQTVYITQPLPEPTAAPSSTPAATPVPTPTAAPSPTPLPELKPVLDFSKDKDGTMLSMHNTARYAYEQGALPQFLFENEKAVCDDILNNPENLATNIDAVWTKVANAALIRMMTESETEYVISDEAQLYELIDSLTEDYALAPEDVFSISYHPFENDITVVLLELADMEEILLSSYVGIAYHKETGIRYFTLEKSFGDLYIFCEVQKNGRGSLRSVKNTKAAFLDAVKGFMNSLIVTSNI